MISGLTVGEIVNGASGMLFALTGLAIFALARGSTPQRLLGITLAVWGLSYPAAYFLVEERATATFDAAASGVHLVASIAIGWLYPNRADRKDSLRLAVVLALGLAWALNSLVIGGFGDLLLGQTGPPLGTVFTLTALAFLPSAFAVRALRQPTHATRLALLALVFGLYGAYNAARIVVWLPDPRAPTFYYLALSLLPAFIWLRVGAAGGAPRVARNTALAIPAAAFLGATITTIVGSEQASQLGVPGALRTLSWGLLALAIFKHGLLDRPLPRVAISRGPLAAAALAALLIVAQIAQEFLADEYGLLMGGVVAGALLFAANPIQRAAERIAERAVSIAPAVAQPNPNAGQRAYRLAVLAALRDDDAIGAREEQHLADLADELGIKAGDALRIRREVEKEAAQGDEAS